MEKLSEEITYRTINGLVLVLPDEDYETFQIEGRETKIFTSLAAGTAGERACVSGTVLAVPETINYNGQKILDLKKKGLRPDLYEKEMDRLKKESVAFDVDVEIKKGDKVLFFYKNQIDCYRDGRSVPVTVEENGVFTTKFALLMKYDTLNAVELSPDILKPLNGFIFVQRLDLKSEVSSKSGLELVNFKMMGGLPKKRGFAIGRVIETGSECRGYIDFLDIKPCGYPIKSGDYVYLDERYTNNLQHANHQTHKTPRIIVKRKDIHGVVLDPSKLELA
jgi:hypothetical protein